MTKAERAARNAHKARIEREFRTGIASLAFALDRCIYWSTKAHRPPPWNPELSVRGIVVR